MIQTLIRTTTIVITTIIIPNELVEITPKNIRLRKRLLNATDRKKAAVRAGQVNK